MKDMSLFDKKGLDLTLVPHIPSLAFIIEINSIMAADAITELWGTRTKEDDIIRVHSTHTPEQWICIKDGHYPVVSDAIEYLKSQEPSEIRKNMILQHFGSTLDDRVFTEEDLNRIKDVVKSVKIGDVDPNDVIIIDTIPDAFR